jgi:ABC-type methionine transport system ATPase subunit
MPIEFREAALGPLQRITAIVPDGATIGIVGLKGAGAGALLRLATGAVPPESGTVSRRKTSRLITSAEPLDCSPVDVLGMDGAFACLDSLDKAIAATALERMRRAGTTIFLASHDEPLLMRLADEIWWLDAGRLRAKGDPRETLAKYREFVTASLAEWGRALQIPLDVSRRRGDALAEIVELSVPGVLKSGEPAAIRVAVRFRESVDQPVVGIMIRTRIGFEVYGTNTELEGLRIGPQPAGATVQLEFAFRCDLCPGDYTLTAACHDPDGSAHDWLDDAVAFSVADSRYTAGVANLRATVRVVGAADRAPVP